MDGAITTPQRVQLQRTKGWRLPANTVKVDRSTRWGNPAAIGKPWEGEVVENALHAKTIFQDGVNCACEPFPTIDAIRTSLRGKNVACWCRLDEPCHGDHLLEVANA